MKRVKRAINVLINILSKPELVYLPANLAFFIVLSIFPVLSLIDLFASYFSVSIDNIIKTLRLAIPSELNSLIIPYIKSPSSNVLISTVISFIIASNGTHALILSSNSLYKFNNSSYLKRRIKALFLILLLIILFMFMIMFLTYGNQIFRIILEVVTYEPVNEVLFYTFALMKWPLAMIIIYLIIKIIYTLAPDDKVNSNTTAKGALFTTFGWIIATAIYSYYVNNFANYDIYYGSISNVIVLMIWIYILSFILVIGIAINSRYYHKQNRE